MVALPQINGPQTAVQIALAQAAQGRSVIPVKRAHDKADRLPLVKWAPYQTQRPTADEIRAWWQTWPTANPVIVTGALSGMIALDVDGPDGLAWLVAQGLPATFTVTRGAAGRYHFWFKHPGFRVPCRVLRRAQNGDPLVEVKGDGGLIPAPGALHWSGAPYTVKRDLPLADCPAWLIDLLKPQPAPVTAYQPGPDDDQLIPLALDALSAARSTDRDDWLAVGMALQSAGEGYRALWHTFSSRCPEKYNPRVVDQAWQGFKRSGVTVATLFWMADQDSPNWRKDARPRDLCPIIPIIRSYYQGHPRPAATQAAAGETGRGADTGSVITGDNKGQTWPDALPAGVISAALVCASSQIALALVKPSGVQPGDRLEPSELVGQLSKFFVYRALTDPGAVQFVAELPLESLSKKEESQEDSQGKSATNSAGRRSTAITPRPWGDILADLDRALPDHLLRFYFPAEGEHALLPTGMCDRLLLDDDPAALDLLKQAAARQDERETRRAVKQWRKAVHLTRARLHSPEAVTIPAEWHNLVELRRYLARAIHDADPQPRDYAGWSLLTGVNHRSVGALLAGAGLQNEPQTLEVEVDAANPIVDAKRKAYQVGKIAGFMVTRPDGTRRALFEPLDQVEETLAREVQPGAKVTALLRRPAKQVVVGEVRGTVRREAVQGEKTAAKAAGQVAPKSTLPRLALPVFEAYRRDAFILAYERLTGEAIDRDLRRALSPREAQYILTGAYRLADERLIDGATGEILKDFRPAPVVARLGKSSPPEGVKMAYNELMDEVIEESEPAPLEMSPMGDRPTVHPLLTPPTAPTADEIAARQIARRGFSIFGNGRRADALTGSALAMAGDR